MIDADTIVAIATPAGVSAIAVLRISGSQAHRVATRCFAARRTGLVPNPAQLYRGWLLDARDGERLDDALACWFFAPRSYSGEHMLELHVHGGAGVAAAGLASVLHAGARLAAPGEFTKRAFLNGRLDLAQAEAVADLINAETTRSARAAVARLQGKAGNALRTLREQLLARLIEIEAHLDYPDEVVPPDERVLAACISAQLAEVHELLRGASGARALRDGIDCVIAGPPNAGKSSLLNALLQAERAIVSAIPGTTRDIVEDRVAVEGVVLRLRDTAGVRETSDVIEAEGVARARKAVAEAELVLAVIDASKPLGENERSVLALTESLPRVVVGNKLDLGTAGLSAMRDHASQTRNGARQVVVSGSILDDKTVAQVRAAIAELGWGGAMPDANTALIANARQLEALTRAQEALIHAARTLQQSLPIDLLSGDLRSAAAAYGEVTGDTVSAEIIDGIFARFCVGK